MDRRRFLTRLGMFGALPIIAAAGTTITNTVQPNDKTVIDGDVEINGSVTINSQTDEKSVFVVNRKPAESIHRVSLESGKLVMNPITSFEIYG